MPDDKPAMPTPDTARTRDHLANERTYLAWARPGITLMGLASW